MPQIELRARIVVDTPLGEGVALLVERTPDDQFWTVAISDSCAIVTFRQEQLRIARSYTDGRGISDQEMRRITQRKRRRE